MESVTVFVKTAGSGTKRSLSISTNATLHEVKAAVADTTGLSLDRLKLVLHGKTLEENGGGGGGAAGSRPRLTDGATLIALVAPKAPPAHVSSRDGEIEDEEEDLRFRLPDNATPVQRRLATWMKTKLKLPDYVLVVFFWFSLRTWALLFLWLLAAPVVQIWDLGPIYILVSCFAAIFFNLGRRGEGELSAYSIFNEGFRELPGTLNADRLDQDIRAGQF